LKYSRAATNSASAIRSSSGSTAVVDQLVDSA
jgi:hypothetical protein